MYGLTIPPKSKIYLPLFAFRCWREEGEAVSEGCVRCVRCWEDIRGAGCSTVEYSSHSLGRVVIVLFEAALLRYSSIPYR